MSDKKQKNKINILDSNTGYIPVFIIILFVIVIFFFPNKYTLDDFCISNGYEYYDYTGRLDGENYILCVNSKENKLEHFLEVEYKLWKKSHMNCVECCK